MRGGRMVIAGECYFERATVTFSEEAGGMGAIPQYETYLFDADGTLIDTIDLIYHCFRYTCKRFGHYEISRERVIQTIGIPLHAQLQKHLGPMDKKQLEHIADVHMEH